LILYRLRNSGRESVGIGFSAHPRGHGQVDDVVANARNRSKRRIECLEIAVGKNRTRVGYGRVFQFKMVQNALDLLRLDLISNKNPICNK
jgi:hypothetical protein